MPRVGPRIALLLGVASALQEQERVAEYKRRGFSWNDDRWFPKTPGWRNLMERRELQIGRIKNTQQRWDAWTNLVQGGSELVRNFTRNGFAVATTPPAVHAKLSASLLAGLARAPVYEEGFPKVLGDRKPTFVAQNALNWETMKALQPLHEQWAGVKLEPRIAYGLRVYGNGSNLLMHLDKAYDHVVSSIVHVGHDKESEPWPLVIEGFDGNTHEVTLKEGQMLFYESSKCLHGRPRTFRGRYYSSLFVHYRPVDYPLSEDDKEYRVPPGWNRPNPEHEQMLERRFDALHPQSSAPVLEIRGTGMTEPDCPSGWCLLAPSAPSPTPSLDALEVARDEEIARTAWASQQRARPAGGGAGVGGGFEVELQELTAAEGVNPATTAGASLAAAAAAVRPAASTAEGVQAAAPTASAPSRKGDELAGARGGADESDDLGDAPGEMDEIAEAAEEARLGGGRGNVRERHGGAEEDARREEVEDEETLRALDEQLEMTKLRAGGAARPLGSHEEGVRLAAERLEDRRAASAAAAADSNARAPSGARSQSMILSASVLAKRALSRRGGSLHNANDRAADDDGQNPERLAHVTLLALAALAGLGLWRCCGGMRGAKVDEESKLL